MEGMALILFYDQKVFSIVVEKSIEITLCQEHSPAVFVSWVTLNTFYYKVVPGMSPIALLSAFMVKT